MSNNHRKTTASFILLDANSNLLKDIEYKVTTVSNNEERHLVKGKTNSKGATYEFVKPIGTKLCLYVKIGTIDFKKVECLILPSTKKNILKIIARVNAILVDSKLKKHGGKVGDIKRKDYKIVQGDTLGSIAKKHNTNVQQLMSLNSKIKSIHKIYEGDWLKVPAQIGDVSKDTINNSSQPSSNKITTSTYRIESGDTLSEISERSGKSVSDLQKINNISNRHQIRKDQVLTLEINTTSKSVSTMPTATETENNGPTDSERPWYDKAWDSVSDITDEADAMIDKAEEALKQGQQKIINKTNEAMESVADANKKIYDTVFDDDDTESSKTNDKNSTSKTKPSNSKSKANEPQLSIQKEVGNNQKGNPAEQITYDNDTTVYHIYHDGHIERANRQAVGYARFIYYDESGSKHDLGRSAYKTAQRWIKKNIKDGERKVYLIDIRDFLHYKKGNVQYKIHKNSEGSIRYYLTGVALAAYLGTLCKLGYTDISFNGFSDVNGGPGDSASHINGEVGDMRYVRKDYKALAVTVFENIYSHKRNVQLIETLYLFGFGRTKLNYTEAYSKPELRLKNYILPHCEHYRKGKVRHHHHLHLQGLKANIKDVDVIHKVQQTTQPLDTLTLSKQDVIDLIKVTSTEVVTHLKGASFEKQAAGVVDTILNRVKSGKWGNSFRSVINARRQFSKITGPSTLNPYGSVESMPWSDVNSKTKNYVLEYLLQRANGKPSIIGGHLNYANKYYSDAYNRRTWVDKFHETAEAKGLIFGSGKSIHAHGTEDYLEKYIPKPFSIKLPKNFREIK